MPSYVTGHFKISQFWVLPVFSWVSGQRAAEEEDAGAVVFDEAKAARIGFDGLDLAVES